MHEGFSVLFQNFVQKVPQISAAGSELKSAFIPLFQWGNLLSGLQTSPFDGLRAGFWKRGKGRFSADADRNYAANCWVTTLGLIITLIMTLSSSAWAQSGKPRTLNELAAYTGPDRQKIILDGAKAEGKVLWYTSLSGNYRELVDAFKKKYPEIQIEVYRAGSSDVSQRLLSEAKAGRYLADALETTPGALMLLREAGVLKAYTSPELAKFPGGSQNEG
jgi:hypothetical protein